MNLHPTFDRLRLSLSGDAITILQPSLFTTTVNGDGEVLRTKYEHTTPFYYSVQLDNYKHNAIVEFSGKALLDEYPNLISYTNFSKCVENINSYEVCYIQPNEAYNHGYVMQCDVTRDVTSCSGIKELQTSLTLTNARKWCVRDITSNRFTIESANTTKRRKTRMVVYDKSIEMSRKSNDLFLSAVNNREQQIDYFQGKIRYELNLNSIDRIRTYFKANDTKVSTLLMSDEDPIKTFLTTTVVDDCGLHTAANFAGNLRSLEHLLLLAVCNYDLRQVELLIRELYGGNRSISRSLEPYQQLYTQLTAEIPLPNENMTLLEIRNHLRYMMANTFCKTPSMGTNLVRLYNEGIRQAPNVLHPNLPISYSLYKPPYDPDLFN